jgi:hypothetical protein
MNVVKIDPSEWKKLPTKAEADRLAQEVRQALTIPRFGDLVMDRSGQFGIVYSDTPAVIKVYMADGRFAEANRETFTPVLLGNGVLAKANFSELLAHLT